MNHRNSRTTSWPKRLVYVVNHISVDDTQHFAHIIALLNMLERDHGWSIKLLSEKGGRGTDAIQDRKVTYLSQRGNVRRIFSLLAWLVHLRRKGYRLIFVRISKPAAIISTIVARLLGMKVLYWLSTSNYDLDRKKPAAARFRDDALLRFVVLGVDRFVTGPEYMLEYCAKYYRVPREKLLLLYNDVDLLRFHPPAEAAKPDGPLRILFVHSLSPSKAATFYLPAIIAGLNRLSVEGRAIVLDIIGDGPERPEVESQIRAASAEFAINMHGSVPNLELPTHLARADIFIMPSYREGMPRALMEAMAMGLPAVATDAGGTRDLVGPLQSRYVVSRDDPAAFAERLVELACDAALQKTLGVENIVRVQRYSTPVVASMYDRELAAML